MGRFIINKNGNKQQDQESTLGAVGRNIATVGARVGEAALGLPGDIASGITSGVNYLLEKAGTSPKLLPQAPEFLPTSQQLREMQPQYLQPQSKTAEAVGEAAQLVTRALLPPFGAKSLASIPGIIGRAVLGETAARGVSELGGGPLSQELARTGTFFLNSLFKGKGAAKTAMTDAYTTARKSVENQTLPLDLTKNLKVKNIHFIKELPRKVLDDKAKSFLKTNTAVVNRILQQKNPSIEKLWDAKIAINDALKDFRPASPEYRAIAQFSNSITDTLRNYGKNVNPDFLNNFSQAEDFFKAFQASNNVSQFLRENTSVKALAKKPLYKLLAFKLSPTATAAGIGLGVGATEAHRLYDLFSQSKQARKYFADFMKGALAENATQTINNFNKLEKLYNPSSGRYVINRKGRQY